MFLEKEILCNSPTLMEFLEMVMEGVVFLDGSREVRLSNA